MDYRITRIKPRELFEIHIINVVQARELRAAVLRPDQAPERLVYLGDDAPKTLHFGAFEDHKLVGVVSIMHQAPKDFSGFYPDRVWLLRGMATLPEVRGKGYGTALVRSGCAYIAREHGFYLWCDARESALGFYEKLGFTAQGDLFDLPITGPHYRMVREVTAADAAYSPF